MLSGPDHPQWKGGRYAHIYKGRLKQHFEALQADVDDPLDLLPELEVQRVLLARAIEDLVEVDNPVLLLHGSDNTNYQKHTDPIQLRPDTEIPDGQIALDQMPAAGQAPNTPAPPDDDDPEHTSQEEKAGTTMGVTLHSTLITTHKDTSAHPPVVEFSTQPEKRVDPDTVLSKVEMVQQLANDVVKTVTQIIVSRNQTALTLTEVKWMRQKMLEGLERFIPDPEVRAAYIRWLIEEIPGGDDARGLEATAGSAAIPAPAKAE